MSFFRGLFQHTNPYKDSRCVQEAIELIRFLKEAGVTIHLVYITPACVAAWVSNDNGQYEYLGVPISTYLSHKNDSRPEFAKAFKEILLNEIQKYFGTEDAVARFESLNLDVDLLKGDDDHPLIKRYIYFPEFHAHAYQYAEAIEEWYRESYSMKLSIIPEEKVP